MEFTNTLMTFALLETIQDDTDEGTSKIEKLIVPLALCGCMGSGQQNPMGAALLEWGRARGYSALWCFLPGLPVSVRA